MRLVLAFASLVALAGCGAKESVSADEVIAEAGKLEKPLPGQYVTSVRLIDFSVPGIPPKQADQLKSMMGGVGGQSGGYCLTQAEADKGFEDGIRKMTEGGAMTCAYDRFKVEGNRLAGALRCTGREGMKSTITIDGTAGREANELHLVMDQNAPMIPGGTMRMELEMASRRTGDCA